MNIVIVLTSLDSVSCFFSPLGSLYFLQKSRHGLGKWYLLTDDHVTCGEDHKQASSDHVTHARECRRTLSSSEELPLLKGMLSDLTGGKKKEEGEGPHVCLANQIHWLVDTAPVKPEG